MRAKRVAFIAAIVVVLAGLVAGVPETQATAEQRGYLWFDAVATSVRVNQSGGITVAASLDCTPAVWHAFGVTNASEEEAKIPDGTTVAVGIDWNAYQYVGRTRVITASYGSDHLRPCYSKGVQGPYPWFTEYDYTDSSGSHPTRWVNSTDGKFAAGPIRIELFTQDDGGATFIDDFLFTSGVTAQFIGPGITVDGYPDEPLDDWFGEWPAGYDPAFYSLYHPASSTTLKAVTEKPARRR